MLGKNKVLKNEYVKVFLGVTIYRVTRKHMFGSEYTKITAQVNGQHVETDMVSEMTHIIAKESNK